MTKVDAFAPAKINLALHVTGRRPDGYHLLDSLVTFAAIGDRLTVRAAPAISFGVSGPFGGAVPVDGTNLVLKAAEVMAGEVVAQGRAAPGAAILLEKHLPVASGIGGGSADAAATCRALASLWDVPVPDAGRLAAELGADVPVCLAPDRPYRMRGIGEELSALAALPPLNLLLVNPGVAIETAAVFRGLDRRGNPPMGDLPDFSGSHALVAWLAEQRNDLEPVALELAPAVGEALRELGAMEGCLLARMSGSGATCFAIFSDPEARERAANILRGENPDWWVAEG